MNWQEQIILKLSTLLKVNLLGLAYKVRGIGLTNDFKINGELNFLKNNLLNLIGEKSVYTFFDVGQNKGEYTKLLLSLGLNVIIHGFEPNKYLEIDLKSEIGNNPNVKLNNFGLGAFSENKILFNYKNEDSSGHGSLYDDIFYDIRKTNEIIQIPVKLQSIENYCLKNHIDEIDFIKIDVEGHELDVLKGAGKFLNKIKVIQFEFNETNIISRVFLRDYYKYLNSFSFYRLTENGYVSINEYNSINEIFRIQNIIAINNNG